MDADPLAPGLLVAMPQLLDPNFRRSVVLLVAHSEDGAMGFVVNRTLPAGVKDVLHELKIQWAGDDDEKVWGGGPVMPESGWVLFEAGPGAPLPDSHEVLPGVCLSASLETLRFLAAAPPRRFRLLLGHAGWGAGQLENELVESAWLVVPIAPNLLFETPAEEMWAASIRSLGVEPDCIVPGHGVQ